MVIVIAILFCRLWGFVAEYIYESPKIKSYRDEVILYYQFYSTFGPLR